MLYHWGRPVNTIVYMVPALFGLVGARLASLTLAAFTVTATVLLAKRLQVGYFMMVPVLLLFQPWFLRWASQPAMTEIPFSLMLVLSALLFVSNRILLASLLIGLFPLVRMEALALTVVWVALCLRRRTWSAAVVASLPFIFYSVLVRILLAQVPDPFPLNPFLLFTGHMLTLPQPAAWRASDWLAYPKLLVHGVGLPVAALSAYGAIRLARRAQFAVVAGYGVYAALHVFLYRVGIEGYPEERYWLPLAPLVSIAAAEGLELIVRQVSRITRSEALRTAPAGVCALALAVVLAAVVVSGLHNRPTPANPGMAEGRAAATWLQKEHLRDPLVLSLSSGWFRVYFPARVERLGTPVTNSPLGSIAVWDSQGSDDWGISWAVLSSDHKWRLLKTFTTGNVRMAIFHKELP